MSTPEEVAEQFVSLAEGGTGGGRRVQLSVSGSSPVQLRPHANPSLARAEVAAVRRVVAAAIRAGQAGGSSGGRVGQSARSSGADE